MRYFKLFWQLLRPRVAVMLILFALIGYGFNTPSPTWHWYYIFVPLLLACWYVNATSINDLSDEAIDKINLKSSVGRPLVKESASRHQVLILNAATLVLTVIFGALLSPVALLMALLGLCLNYAYSAPPLRLSYRGYIAPLVLPFGYVAVPYVIGSVGLGAPLSASGTLLLLGLYVCFAGRIILKDLRDVVGDKAFGKRTLTVIYGKKVVCTISCVAWLVGDVLLIKAIGWSGRLIPAQYLLAVILYCIWRLNKASDQRAEQVYIGLLAKAANGILVGFIALFFMHNQPANQTGIVVFSISLLYAAQVITGLSDPEKVRLGYKG